MNNRGYIIKIYGVSCDCYVSSALGKCSTKLLEAHEFGTKQDAINVAVELYTSGNIGHWEIKAAPPRFFPSCS